MEEIHGLCRWEKGMAKSTNQKLKLLLNRIRQFCRDDTHFQITVDVAVSNNFFGWLIGLGNGVKIIAPDNVVEDMKQYIMQMHELYGIDA